MSTATVTLSRLGADTVERIDRGADMPGQGCGPQQPRWWRGWRSETLMGYPNYDKSLEDFQREVGMWAESVFTASTLASVIAHFRREATEFVESGEIEEAADCLLLLLHYAHKLDYSLMDAAEAKLKKNRKRKWGKPDKEGVVEHVRN